jgi:hypothetical protein
MSGEGVMTGGTVGSAVGDGMAAGGGVAPQPARSKTSVEDMNK